MSQTVAAEPNSSGSSTDRYLLQSVTRALRVLDLLAEAGVNGFTVTELAQQLQASKSTTFALLHTLTSQSYVVEVPPGPRYRLGHAVIRLADSLTQGLGLTDICRPVMADLTEKTGWTSRAAICDDGYPIFFDRIDGPGTIRFHTPLGRRELPHHSAAGKAMLTTLDDHRIRIIAEQTGLPVRTRHTIVTVDDLLADIALSRRRGFTVDDEEDAAGVFCVGAAFSGRDGHCAGAISITGLKIDVPSRRVQELGDLVRAHADQIALGIGGRPWQTDAKVGGAATE